MTTWTNYELMQALIHLNMDNKRDPSDAVGTDAGQALTRSVEYQKDILTSAAIRSGHGVAA